MCYELINDGVLIATNIFALQDGLWKMVHHQAGATMGLPQQSADKAI